MPVYKFKKSYIAPALGVNFDVKPHLLGNGQWFNLDRMRCMNGAVSGFPGHIRLDTGTRTGPVSLLGEYRRKSGTVNLMYGDATKLGILDTTTLDITDLTAALSLAPTRDHPWDYITYADVFYITNKADGVHQYTGAGNFTAVASSPDGWFIRVLNNHLVTFGDGANPFTLSWAAEGTSTFTASSTNDAGAFDILDTDDEAAGLHNIGQSLAAYKRKSIHRIDYIGGRAIMSSKRMVGDVGLIGSAIAPFTDKHIFMGDPPGFYEYVGGNSVDRTIGIPVTNKVFNELNFGLRNRSRCLVMPITRELLFFYPSTLSTNDCDRVVIYNDKEKIWYGPFTIAASATRYVTYVCNAQISVSAVINSFSSGTINAVSDIIDSYGSSPGISYDLYGATNGKIMHISGNMEDNTIAVTREAETGDLAIGVNCENSDGVGVSFPLGTVYKLLQVNLDFEDIDGPNISFYVGAKMDLSDTYTWHGPFTVASNQAQHLEVPVIGTNEIPIVGRWFRFKFILMDSSDMSLLNYQPCFDLAGVR